MYCGCNPTALSSQLQISEALVRLMEKKLYSEITVSELCRESGISRQTFYTLFHAKENVVVFTLQKKACELPREPETDASLEQLCRCYSRYICANREFLQLLIESNATHLLYDSIRDSLMCCPEQTLQPQWQYAASYLAGGLTGIMRQCCLTEPAISADALYGILYELMSGAMWK
jgi:AcrR family transcriptional regulator